MSAFIKTVEKSPKNIYCVYLFIFIWMQSSYAINLGLIAGDNKPLGAPLVIRKYSKHSPVFININPLKAPVTLPPLPKLPSKPPPKSLLKPSKLSAALKLPKPIIPRVPLIPRLPILPVIPPILPIIPPPLPLLPIISPLPIIPLPLLPRIPRLPKLTGPFSPLKVPILGKTPLQKALGSELSPVTVLHPEYKRRENVLEKLLELKNRGSLTTAEFVRFKKLLLRK